ncbi:MAG: NAD-dependent epimerase/dehydratase family protein [Gammaproteobacteria bacterium]|nr:NAD-dependent epimerase/dehydratase family protein [Gammaproteobacteria bacterium]
MKNTVIIGYGQLGTELCQQLIQHDQHVTTVSRSQHACLSSHHDHQIADLDSAAVVIRLPPDIDTLYYFAPPADTDLSDQRLRTLLAYLQAHRVAHIIYISTSGVYGDCKGALVTETAALRPATARAKRRLDAEHQLQQFNTLTATAVTILRCAAIYSAKTINRQRIIANSKPVIRADSAPYTNRIHLDDLVAVCLCAGQKPAKTLEIYNVSDGHASTTTEHAWLLSDLTGQQRNKQISMQEAEHYYSPAYLSYLHESKRLDITKLKRQLQPAFKFENINKGILHCLKQAG